MAHGLAGGAADAVSARWPVPQIERYRTIWLSDMHLGSSGCQVNYLLDFLQHTESQYLYLVGDIIDGWRLKKDLYWPRSHGDVVQAVLHKARTGTAVAYIPGNRDESIRPFCGYVFGEVQVLEEAFHLTLAGKRLWIVHGDLFDSVMQHARWLACLGARLYSASLMLERCCNLGRRWLGLPYWPLSQYLKRQVKNVTHFSTSFEQAVADGTRQRGCDGIVCGHIHQPEIRDIDGVLYCNDGDWVESLSALVETLDGELKLVYWTALRGATTPASTRKARRFSL
ncbi:UDP-2,3-diacylglucosamine diphosphatase [Paraburkholderia bonniea]|uniref:UDP-2,3-diacylglucosamine diphosphatase n=1 Tax=Paraburkholderia bonniea TaxID=2152891 RepID=UPI003CCDD51F